MNKVLIYVPKELKNYGYQTKGSVGFDICANEDVILNPGETKVVGTGIRIKILDDSFFAAVFPRSSLPLKKNLILANSVGIIDLDYCGKDDEIKLILHNIGKDPIRIKKGERLAQIVFLKFEKPKIEITNDIEVFDQGSRGGLGSTGD